MVQNNNIEYSFKESSNIFIDQFGIKNANEKSINGINFWYLHR